MGMLSLQCCVCSLIHCSTISTTLVSEELRHRRYTMEYSSTAPKDAISPFAMVWIELEGGM